MTDTRSDLQRAFDEGYEKGKADRPSAVDLSSVYSTAYKSGYEKGKADRPQGWIPCSERLPEEDEEVLVCDKDGTMEVCDLEMFGRGIGLKWTDKNGYECWLDVVAWMPLPEPWKGADDE